MHKFYEIKQDYFFNIYAHKSIIMFKDVYCFNANSDWTKIFDDSPSFVSISRCLGGLLTEISKPYFYRCHNSWGVNITKVDHLEPPQYCHLSFRVIFNNDTFALCSPPYLDHLVNLVDDYKAGRLTFL
jgi:hypothetical protein